MREGLGFVNTHKTFNRELESIKQTLDQSPDRVTLVYAVSSAAMVCRYGRQGVDDCLREVERLCLQLLWERQGALKISILADHGHNLIPSQFVSIKNILNEAGFAVRDKIQSNTDIVIDTEGLVTYAGIHTQQPAAVADVLLQKPQIQLALYMQGQSVIVRDSRGSAAIEKRGGKIRYVAIDRDVLGYQPVRAALAEAGKADTEGFASADDWFAATVDHEWPNAPPRIWTFLLSMTGRSTRPLRSSEVLQTIEPGYMPAVRPGK